MATTLSPIASPIPAEWTLADMLEHLGALPGGDVLPGFGLSMKDVFAYVEGRRSLRIAPLNHEL